MGGWLATGRKAPPRRGEAGSRSYSERGWVRQNLRTLRSSNQQDSCHAARIYMYIYGTGLLPQLEGAQLWRRTICWPAWRPTATGSWRQLATQSEPSWRGRQHTPQVPQLHAPESQMSLHPRPPKMRCPLATSHTCGVAPQS